MIIPISGFIGQLIKLNFLKDQSMNQSANLIIEILNLRDILIKLSLLTFEVVLSLSIQLLSN